MALTLLIPQCKDLFQYSSYKSPHWHHNLRWFGRVNTYNRATRRLPDSIHFGLHPRGEITHAADDAGIGYKFQINTLCTLQILNYVIEDMYRCTSSTKGKCYSMCSTMRFVYDTNEDIWTYFRSITSPEQKRFKHNSLDCKVGII